MMIGMVHSVKELWTQAILPYNLPLTVLLALVVLYWVLSIIGAIAVDDVDVDVSGDAQVGLGDISAFLLRAVNAHSVPVTIVLSVLVLAMWIGSILLNYYLNPGLSTWLGFAYLLAAFVIGVIATKVITQPLVPFMRRLKEAEDAAPVIGEIGVVKSIDVDTRFGQVEVMRPGGAPALLNARVGPDSEPILRGTSVAILSYDEPSGLYLVRAVSPVPSLE